MSVWIRRGPLVMAACTVRESLRLSGNSGNLKYCWKVRDIGLAAGKSILFDLYFIKGYKYYSVVNTF